MPPKPIAPTPSVSQTWLRFRAPSSRKGLASAWAGSRGANRATNPMVITARTLTMAKVQRQPKAWLTRLAKGTPMTVATVSPIRMVETARVRRCSGTMEAATRAATPK